MTKRDEGQRRVRYDNDDKLDGMRCLLEHVSGNQRAIEDAEAEGQQRLVNSSQLPIQGTQDEAAWLAIGVRLGPPTDSLFRDAELPQGWTLQAGDHDMWSYLLDQHGRRRASIFYKAAFYDRRATINMESRYQIRREYNPPNLSCRVLDGEREIFRMPEIKSPLGENPTLEERKALVAIDNEQRQQCERWLDENRPAWRDPVAQWSEPLTDTTKPSRHIETIARNKDRDYITPEDVQDAIDRGAPRLEVWDELLAILGKQRGLGAEDASLCCFVAREHKTSKVKG